LNLLSYCIVSLLSHTEYSVREYSLHALSDLLPIMDERLFKKVEGYLFSQLKAVRDEMIISTILLAVRSLVV